MWFPLLISRKQARSCENFLLTMKWNISKYLNSLWRLRRVNPVSTFEMLCPVRFLKSVDESRSLHTRTNNKTRKSFNQNVKLSPPRAPCFLVCRNQLHKTNSWRRVRTAETAASVSQIALTHWTTSLCCSWLEIKTNNPAGKDYTQITVEIKNCSSVPDLRFKRKQR